ncbi:MAG TPA: hypothetical protein PKL96_09390, partial [Bacteroidales bacterium]|nr:hypothetical protein [Bacteroidales bacterium]
MPKAARIPSPCIGTLLFGAGGGTWARTSKMKNGSVRRRNVTNIILFIFPNYFLRILLLFSLVRH